MDRRKFVQTAGGIFVASTGLGSCGPDKLPLRASVTANPPDPTKCTVILSGSTVAVGSAVVMTLQAKDSSGNNIVTGGATVVFSASGGTSTGTISATTDHGDGTYSATYTGTGAGTAQTIGATINGSSVTTTILTLTVTGAIQAPDPTKCTVSLSASTVGIGSAVTMTLQARDSSNNFITTGGATVVFSASGGTSTGTVGATTDRGNGTYTATYTGTAAGTPQTIGATINGSTVTTQMPTITVSNAYTTPDILNNLSFEATDGDGTDTPSGVWDGFVSAWGGSSKPTGGSVTTLARATDQFYAGSTSVKYTWIEDNSGNSGANFWRTFGGGVGYDRVWLRFYMRLASGWAIASVQKFLRFHDVNTAPIGIWELSTSDGLTFDFDTEASAVGFQIVSTSSLNASYVDQWVSVEVDYWRNGDTGFDGVHDLPSAAFWINGTQLYNGGGTGQPNGPDPKFSGAYGYWVGGRLYPYYPAHGRVRSTKLYGIRPFATLNNDRGASAGGTCWMDRIAASSLGRIGP
jgi:hypothetical protein